MSEVFLIPTKIGKACGNCTGPNLTREGHHRCQDHCGFVTLAQKPPCAYSSTFCMVTGEHKGVCS